MNVPRIVATPIAGGAKPSNRRPRQVDPSLLDAALPGPGRDRLSAGGALVVTTGQQPGLFTGPLYTIYKALSAIALARRLERERRTPVVPVFWVAGDDHDFSEANHVFALSTGGEPVRLALRERPADAPLVPLARERVGPEITATLEALRTAMPDTEFKPAVFAWLEAAYRPDATLADAFAHALDALLGSRGLVVFRPYHPAAKRLMAPLLLRSLSVTLEDGYLPVLLEGSAGRDRLRADGAAFVARRSGERFSRRDVERLADEAPERLSPNVLLRPAIEAALLPTVAYAAGPAELEYFPKAEPLYRVLGDAVEPQPAVARWSGVLVEPRVDKVLQKHNLSLDDLAAPPGALEARLVSETLPRDVSDALGALRSGLEDGYRRLAQALEGFDPTLVRSVESARNAALTGTRDIEKKLVASLKRTNESLVGQVVRARSAVFPGGKPQERALTLATFLVRYGPPLIDALEAEVARWAGGS
ncbi:MAG TPA: bacillithiol biosynthesis BshC [Gemmatimonadales bacterium]